MKIVCFGMERGPLERFAGTKVEPGPLERGSREPTNDGTRSNAAIPSSVNIRIAPTIEMKRQSERCNCSFLVDSRIELDVEILQFLVNHFAVPWITIGKLL